MNLVQCWFCREVFEVQLVIGVYAVIPEHDEPDGRWGCSGSLVTAYNRDYVMIDPQTGELHQVNP